MLPHKGFMKIVNIFLKPEKKNESKNLHQFLLVDWDRDTKV